MVRKFYRLTDSIPIFIYFSARFLCKAERTTHWLTERKKKKEKTHDNATIHIPTRVNITGSVPAERAQRQSREPKMTFAAWARAVRQVS